MFQPKRRDLSDQDRISLPWHRRRELGVLRQPLDTCNELIPSIAHLKRGTTWSLASMLNHFTERNPTSIELYRVQVKMLRRYR